MKRIFKYISTIFPVLAVTLAATGCSAIKEDDPEPCPQGLEVRFVYEYNLERADAFPAQVECLTLHLYDEFGRFVKTLTETSGVLADKDYHMEINDLPEGTYRLIAYGGSSCDEASILHTEEPRVGSMDTEVGMKLDPECLEPGNPRGHLHDHFYGSVYATVKIAPTLTKVVVPMMKNTNHFRIMLQHLSGEPLDGDDYDFEIIDDNTLFDHTNDLVDTGSEVTYTPWSQGSVATGETDTRAITEVRLAYADMSTSRLMTKRSPRLVVRHRATATDIIDIPLNNYLLALRSNHFAWAGDQEFLDRKSDWQLFFFLDDDRHWNQAYIKVDDWIVRINDIKE